MVYGLWSFCLNLILFDIVHFLETKRPPPEAKRVGKTQPDCYWHKVQSIWPFSASAYGIGAGAAVPTALMLQGSYRLWGDTLLNHIRCSPWQPYSFKDKWYRKKSDLFLFIYFYRKTNNLLISATPNGLMLIWSSLIKCRKIIRLRWQSCMFFYFKEIILRKGLQIFSLPLLIFCKNKIMD